jgi:hypothetical protein
MEENSPFNAKVKNSRVALAFVFCYPEPDEGAVSMPESETAVQTARRLASARPRQACNMVFFREIADRNVFRKVFTVVGPLSGAWGLIGWIHLET